MFAKFIQQAGKPVFFNELNQNVVQNSSDKFTFHRQPSNLSCFLNIISVNVKIKFTESHDVKNTRILIAFKLIAK